ncbi:MAG: hypothetical protein IT431_14450 [Phycisphaerales bacterium]|nr:hypothetical protein [Phycisphaerales bacterium]
MTTPGQGNEGRVGGQIGGQIEGKDGLVDYGRLRTLLDEQEALFVRLDALSKEQSRLVRDEATDDLLRLLGERQGVVASLERASAGLEPFRDRWERVLAGARAEQRDRFAAQLERLSEIAAAIAARDDADRRAIEERRDRLAGELSGVGNVRGAVAAYGQSGVRPAARFQDREG